MNPVSVENASESMKRSEGSHIALLQSNTLPQNTKEDKVLYVLRLVESHVLEQINAKE